MKEQNKKQAPQKSSRDSQLNQMLNLLVFSFVILILGVVATGLVLYVVEHPQPIQQEMVEAEVPTEPLPSEVNEIKDGIDVATGFVAEGDYLLVKSNCTACHSSKLVLQNRATKEGWQEMIRWMQQTQKLWDLGENEEKILAYLARHYGPEDKGRRAPLAVEEWYEIE